MTIIIVLKYRGKIFSKNFLRNNASKFSLKNLIYSKTIKKYWKHSKSENFLKFYNIHYDLKPMKLVGETVLLSLICESSSLSTAVSLRSCHRHRHEPSSRTAHEPLRFPAFKFSWALHIRSRVVNSRIKKVHHKHLMATTHQALIKTLGKYFSNFWNIQCIKELHYR